MSEAVGDIILNSTGPTYDFVNTTPINNGTTGNEPWRILLAIGYPLVFVLAIIGNTMVITVVFRFNHMHTVTNYFLVNLAVADILMSLICLPVTLASNLMQEWVFGAAMCKLVPFLQGTVVSASVNTLVVIAFDRYLAICHTFAWRMTSRVACIIIPLIWIISCAIFGPLLFAYNTVNSTKGTQCIELNWPNAEDRKLFLLCCVFLVCYLIPLVFISIFYTLIGLKVCRRKVPGENNTMAVIKQSNTKVLKMLITIVAAFGLLWLPLYVVGIIYEFSNLDAEHYNTQLASTLYEMFPYVSLLGTMTCCVNPIIYCAFSKKYREAFKLLLTCKVKHNNNTSHRSAAPNGNSSKFNMDSKKLQQRRQLLKRLSGNSFDSFPGTSFTRVHTGSVSSSSAV